MIGRAKKRIVLTIVGIAFGTMLLALVFQAWLSPAIWLALMNGLFLCG